MLKKIFAVLLALLVPIGAAQGGEHRRGLYRTPPP